ncbi:MAG: hypothetical protein P1P69_07880 [Methanosarcinaceae archaeon]|nr:hypothetical protein [Methanosarcinaceae archaeon]
MFKRILHRIFQTFPPSLRKLILDLLIQKHNFSALAQDYGQFNTIRKESCLDRRGKPIPWYTYPAIEYLSHINFSLMRVFEFGSGNSSLWWTKRCRSLTSIESDQQWFGKVSQDQDAGLKFDYRLEINETAYTSSPGLKEADIVIIDGKYRSKCADAFIDACNENERKGLMLLFDNADWYPNSIKKIQQSLGWIQVDFHGFGPINAYTWTTSIFINPKRVPELQYVKPLISIAGIDNAVGNADDAK